MLTERLALVTSVRLRTPPTQDAGCMPSQPFLSSSHGGSAAMPGGTAPSLNWSLVAGPGACVLAAGAVVIRQQYGGTFWLSRRRARRKGVVLRAWDEETETWDQYTTKKGEKEQWSSHNDPEIQRDQVVTVRPKEWEEKVQRMLAAGRDRVCLLLDFDRTMTRTKGRALSQASGGDGLCLLQAWMDKYYPIEIDLVMTKEEKTPNMVEWYLLVNGLLERQNLTRDDVRIAVSQCQDFRLRDGIEELITSVVSKGIPIVIVSAGLGNIIQEVVEQRIWQPASMKGSPWKSMRVLSNNMLWDASGQQTGWSEPLIQPYNKSLADAPIDVQTLLRGRDKVLLCGDSTGDLTIAHGHDTTDILKVGFLNEKIKERLPKYVGNDGYDRVILNDGTFEPVLEIMRKL